tara:strand:+ start:24718 stop:25872 length:1155 start_codon:yes stop_codon:yes gene_type:complete
MLIVVTPYLVITLGIDHYGIYVSGLALCSLYIGILNFDFNLTVVKKIARIKNDAEMLNDAINEVVSVKLLLLVALVVLAVIVYFIVPSFFERPQLYFNFTLLLVANYITFDWLLLGLNSFKFLSLLKFLKFGLFASGMFLWVHSPDDFVLLPLIDAFAVFMVGIGVSIWMFRKFHWNLKLYTLAHCFNYIVKNRDAFFNLNLPSHFGNILILVTSHFGSLIQVGLLQIVLKYSGGFAMLSNMLSMVLYPKNAKEQGLFNFSEKSLLVIGVISSLLMVGSIPFIKWVFPDLVSQFEFNQLQYAVLIAVPVPFCIALISIYGTNGLILLNKDRIYFYATSIAIGAMLLLSSFFTTLLFFAPIIIYTISRALHGYISYVWYRSIKKD